MSLLFTPTKARDLKVGDKLDAHPEHVTVAPKRCDSHDGNRMVFQVEGYGSEAGSHSDICVDSATVFVVRTEVQP